MNPSILPLLTLFIAQISTPLISKVRCIVQNFPKHVPIEQISIPLILKHGVSWKAYPKHVSIKIQNQYLPYTAVLFPVLWQGQCISVLFPVLLKHGVSRCIVCAQRIFWIVRLYYPYVTCTSGQEFFVSLLY